ncbi:MAG: redox-sensing transcriptional repressor Rex [Clostridia bacterium]|nr:redox-sensing transcriptional repressor Rex [Clostridia bacterium]
MNKTKNDTTVSAAVIKRLPRYFRYLRMLLNENKLRISSNDLAELMGVTASQIRQDLNCFGGFGQQGYGYNVTYLYGKISEILGVHENYQAIIIGAGRLGQALAASPVFTKRGVEVCALFDVSADVIGKEVDGRPVLDISQMKEFVKNNAIDIAVLTLPYEYAENAVELIKSLGIKGIWNFTSHDMDHIPGVTVQNVHMGDSLMMLCYDIRNLDNNNEV